MYKRKTKDVYEIQCNYGYGWDCETVEETWKDAKSQLKCYHENISYPVRIVKKREKIEGVV